jgi:hypothetical protein
MGKFYLILDSDDDPQKLRILIDNLPAILSKEMEIFIKAIELVKEELKGLNSKLHSLIDKLENLIQQYGKEIYIYFNKFISSN